MDPRTYQTPSAPLTQRSIEANGLVQIPDAQTRRTLPAMVTLGQTVQRALNMVPNHPEYWPKEVLNPDGTRPIMANQVNVQMARAKMAANQGIDPDLGVIKGMMADVVKLATTAGASSRFSNFIALLEKDSAGWDTPGTRESKIAQFRTTLQRINGQLAELGLEPLPTIVTMPDGRQVTMPRSP